MAHQSFAQAVRDTLKAAAQSGGEVDVAKLSCLLHLQTRQDHKRMLNTLSDLAISGKVVRVRQGVYAEALPAASPDKREVMWRLLKMRRRVTVDDLVEMAGVSRDYAKEWLQLLVRREVARKIQEPGQANQIGRWVEIWVLVSDSAEMPVDETKAARLSNIRLKKKKLMAKIKAIETAVTDVKEIIQTLEDE